MLKRRGKARTEKRGSQNSFFKSLMDITVKAKTSAGFMIKNKIKHKAIPASADAKFITKTGNKSIVRKIRARDNKIFFLFFI